MRPVFVTVIPTLFLFMALFSPAALLAQSSLPGSSEENTENTSDAIIPVLKETANDPLPLPGDSTSKISSMPELVHCLVQDFPEDSGGAVEIRWLLAQGPEVKLFSEQDIPDVGFFGKWTISKGTKEIAFCEKGNRRKDEIDQEADFVANFTSGQELKVKILRATVKNGSVLAPFRVIATISAGGEVEREEYRFSKGVKTVFEPGKTQRTSLYRVFP